ncbi:hypothetical protein I79_024247 [Cricetulus griseus]|uniref:Uncharacterized protein n=1 Tax=Cricetulus griseus TaxID=10029 RepID=G3IK54_CRIGR|nr:hypothetical protein I79_024247 [Cricetulus griseus]
MPLTSYCTSLVNPAECKGYSELSYLIMMLFKQPTYMTRFTLKNLFHSNEKVAETKDISQPRV